MALKWVYMPEFSPLVYQSFPMHMECLSAPVHEGINPEKGTDTKKIYWWGLRTNFQAWSKYLKKSFAVKNWIYIPEKL